MFSQVNIFQNFQFLQSMIQGIPFELGTYLTKSIILHLSTNTMKYFLNANELYYIYYTHAKFFIIKNVVVELKIMD
jgi:hypothetical protein